MMMTSACIRLLGVRRDNTAAKRNKMQADSSPSFTRMGSNREDTIASCSKEIWSLVFHVLFVFRKPHYTTMKRTMAKREHLLHYDCVIQFPKGGRGDTLCAPTKTRLDNNRLLYQSNSLNIEYNESQVHVYIV